MISAGGGLGSSAGGMIVYFAGLLRNLCDLDSVTEVVSLVTPWNGDVALPRHPKLRVATCWGLPRHRNGRVIYEQAVLPLLVRRLNVDILLSTCNVKPLLWRGPSVVVLQSLQYLHFPEQFGRLRTAYLKRAVGRSLHQADAVITVSDWERTEALRLFSLAPCRLTTVYHGVSDAVRAAASSEQLARPTSVGDPPYIVMVSSLYGFKNHRRLVRAFAQVVVRRGVPHRLVLAGGDADVTRAELAALAEDLGIGDRLLLLGGVQHDQVPALLAHADAVAYTSLYETFGLPVLEALASGRPLVASNRGAIPEVAGGAAHLVDAESVESIAGGIADVLLNDTLRSRLIEAGLRRSACFTWERCAEDTAAVLHSVLDARRGPPSASKSACSLPVHPPIPGHDAPQGE